MLMFVEKVKGAGAVSPTWALKSETIIFWESEVDYVYANIAMVLTLRVPVDDSIFASSPVNPQQNSDISELFNAIQDFSLESTLFIILIVDIVVEDSSTIELMSETAASL